MKLRDEALQSILAIKLPADWDPVFHEHSRYERTVFRWPSGVGPGQGAMPTGQVTFTALGSAPGSVEVHGWGCTIQCKANDLALALDLVLKWIDR